MRVVGVDGCPGAGSRSTTTPGRALAPQVHPSFPELLAAYPDAACVGVDTPIGLAEGEPRRCDVESRRVLGPRRSSVFPAPDPRVVTAPTYERALERARSLTGAGISKQAQAIYPKVLEVNWTLTPALQGRVVEVHPEVSLWALAGGRPGRRPPTTCSTRSWPRGPPAAGPRGRPGGCPTTPRSTRAACGWRSSTRSGEPEAKVFGPAPLRTGLTRRPTERRAGLGVVWWGRIATDDGGVLSVPD